MAKNFMNIILTVLFVFCVVLSSLSVDKVKADESQQKYDISSVLNLADADTKQFWEKIKIIKKVFGDKVDDVALAATILYGGATTDILQNEYDEKFDSNKFENEVKSVNSAVESNDSEKKYGETTGRSDLLLAATIVMLDSSNFGTYSDENYEKALAGRNLVGNMIDDNYCKDDDEFKDDNDPIKRLNSIGAGLKSIGARIFNATFCFAGALFDASSSGYQFANYVLQQPNDESKNVGGWMETTAQRYITMSAVCNDGYIGATVSNVRNTKDEKVKCYQKKKIAKEIIQLAQLYRKIFEQQEEEDTCSTSSADATAATNWRQCDSKWGKDKLGSSSQTICQSGCLATSMAYLISKSGTAVSIKNFSPKTFVKNTSFSGAQFQWDFTKSAPNFKLDKRNKKINKNNVVEKVKKELDTPKEVDGKKYQQFVVIQMENHWVAVDHIENDTIYVLDPAADSGTGLVTLDQALNRGNKKRKLITYNTLYATDVEYGKSGSSTETANSCGVGLSTDLGAGKSYNIPNPVPLYGGGNAKQSGIIWEMETYNYSSTTWGYDCRPVREAWIKAGSKSNGGMATLDGRYLVAISKDLASTGDAVDIVLANGQVIRAVLADVKGPERASMYGHNQSGMISLVEWSGENASKSNDTRDKTFSSWKGQVVTKIINYGNYLKKKGYDYKY